MREGRFISAPPEYQAQDVKLYLAPSGAQWTIDRNGAKQVNGERVTQYPMKLSFAYGVWPYEDSHREPVARRPVGDLPAARRPGHALLWKKTACRRARSCARIAKTMTAASGLAPHWASSGARLARFKDGRFTFYGNERELGNLTIHCIFKDREGTIWIGTSGGLHRLTKQFITGYSTASGLLHREVYPILQSRNGDIWVGSIRD